MRRLSLALLFTLAPTLLPAEEKSGVVGQYTGLVANLAIRATVTSAGNGELELKVFPPANQRATGVKTARGKVVGGVAKFQMGSRTATIDDNVLQLFESGRKVATLKKVLPKNVPKNPVKPDGAKRPAGFTSTVVPVDAENLVRKLFWSANGKSLYVLEADGLLRRLDLPGLEEAKRIDLAAKCSDLAITSIGPVVLLNATQHVVLLDEDLNEVQREHVPGAIGVVSAATLDHAFLLADRAIGVWALKKKGRINAIPAASFARAALRVKRTEPRPATIDFRLATCTPDGEYLLTAPDHRITRFRIRRGGLVLEEQGWKVGSSGQPTSMSVGGNPPRVALTFGGGNKQPPGHPPVGYGSYVYDVEDLRVPVTTIEPGPYPRAVGFDTAAGLVYGQSSENELVVFNDGGAKLGAFDLAKNSSERTELILPHPEGGRTLVLTDEKLYWCTLPPEWVKSP